MFSQKGVRADFFLFWPLFGLNKDVIKCFEEIKSDPKSGKHIIGAEPMTRNLNLKLIFELRSFQKISREWFPVPTPNQLFGPNVKKLDFKLTFPLQQRNNDKSPVNFSFSR